MVGFVSGIEILIAVEKDPARAGARAMTFFWALDNVGFQRRRRPCSV
jgi:hypothetical protein